MGVQLAISNARKIAGLRLVSPDAAALEEVAAVSKTLLNPLSAKPWQTPAAGKQPLHRALLDLALFLNQLLKGFDEGISIAQRLCNGFLFWSGR